MKSKEVNLLTRLIKVLNVKIHSLNRYEKNINNTLFFTFSFFYFLTFLLFSKVHFNSIFLGPTNTDTEKNI